MTAQWVQLPGGETLVASHRGAWLQPPQITPFGLHGTMPPSHEATLTTTRHLLEGAIAAAERRVPTKSSAPLTPSGWAFLLVDQWYTAHHSVAVLPVATERYRAMGRRDLAELAERKLEEERGHDLLPLDDLRALGYDPERAIKKVPPSQMARALVEYARACVSGPRPVRLFGYIFALERRVIRITEEMLHELERALPNGTDAASAIRAHAIELDRDHVEDLVQFISELQADDRTEIVLSTYTTAKICRLLATWDRSRQAEQERRLARAQHQALAVSNQKE